MVAYRTAGKYTGKANVVSIYDIEQFPITHRPQLKPFYTMRLRESIPLTILDPNIDNNIPKAGKNCVKAYLTTLFPEHKRTIDMLNPEPTPTEIATFFTKLNRAVSITQIDGKLIKEVKSTTKEPIIHLIADNNHLYIDNKTNIIVDKKVKYLPRDELKALYVKMVKKNESPLNIRANSQSKLQSFEDRTIIYTANDQYELMNSIKDIFGVEININSKIPSIINQIERKYLNDNKDTDRSMSIWPAAQTISKQSFVKVYDNIPIKNPPTIDCNGAHTQFWRKLPYVPVVDIVTDIWYEYTGQPIISTYLYNVKINKQTRQQEIFTPYNDVYMGFTIIRGKNSVKDYMKSITITQVQEASNVDNYYKEIIDTVINCKFNDDILDKFKNTLGDKNIQKLDKLIRIKAKEQIMPSKSKEKLEEKVKELTKMYCLKNLRKNIINHGLGVIEKPHSFEVVEYIGQVANKDTIDRMDSTTKDDMEVNGYKLKIDEVYSTKIGTKKPIAIMIKDLLRLAIYDKIAESIIHYNKTHTRQASFDDLLQINNDSITMNIEDFEFINLSTDPYDGFKKDTYKPVKNHDKSDNGADFSFKEKTKSKLHLGSAGCGKTTIIQKKLIPKLKNDYIVITNNHSAIQEYRRKHFNNSIYQSLCYKQSLPAEYNIICDEIGLFDKVGWDFLLKCKLAGKRIYAFGDKDQLLPIDCSEPYLDIKHLMTLIFEKGTYNPNNWRNNFTEEFYDDIKYNYEYDQLKEIAFKYSVSLDKAEYIITRTNKDRIEYNKLKATSLNIKDIYSIGARVICKTNKLSNYNLYNKHELIVQKINTHVELQEYNYDKNLQDKNPIYRIPIDKYINKNFQLGYAVTLHHIQGKDVRGYHFPETLNNLNRIDGRFVYTLISRIKEELTKETIANNNFIYKNI